MASGGAAGRAAIGIDIGGTSVQAVVVDADGEVRDSYQQPTPATVAATEDEIARAVGILTQRCHVGSVGLAVAGLISRDRRRVLFAPHLAWRDDEVPARLSARLRLPVVMDHDVNAALVAEHRRGAARGADNVLLIAVGTGIGAALLVDGTIYRGAFGVAPEWGHVAVVPDGRECPCGKRGCWERYCSGTALAQSVREHWETAAWGSPTVLAELADSDRAKVTGALVVEAARRGDRVARNAVHELGWWLGAGLAMACDVLDPALVVIGGGVSGAGDLWLDHARASFAARLTGGAHRPHPELALARFGGNASAIGAGLLALDATDG